MAFSRPIVDGVKGSGWIERRGTAERNNYVVFSIHSILIMSSIMLCFPLDRNKRLAWMGIPEAHAEAEGETI